MYRPSGDYSRCVAFGDRRREALRKAAAGVLLAALALDGCGSSLRAARPQPAPAHRTRSQPAPAPPTRPQSARPHPARHAPAAPGTSSPSTAEVSPPVGGPRSVFTVIYTTRLATGRRGGWMRSEVLSARTAGARPGCRSSADAIAPAARAGARVRLRIRPSGVWCPGLWRGQIVAFARPVCPPGRLCPQLILNLGRQASLRFRVTARRR